MDLLTLYLIGFSAFLLTASGINLFTFLRLRELNALAHGEPALRERRIVAGILMISSALFALAGLNGLLHVVPGGVGLVLLSIGLAIEAIPSIYWLYLFYTGGFRDSTTDSS